MIAGKRSRISWQNRRASCRQLDMTRADDQPDTTRYLLYRSASLLCLSLRPPSLIRLNLICLIQITLPISRPMALPSLLLMRSRRLRERSPDIRMRSLMFTLEGWDKRGNRPICRSNIPQPQEKHIYCMPASWYFERGYLYYFFERIYSFGSYCVEGTAPQFRVISDTLNFEISLVDGMLLLLKEKSYQIQYI